MQNLNLELFTPIVNNEFGHDNVLVVKHALGSQPIRRWYKDWKPLTGNEPKADPGIYDTLLLKINTAIENKTIKTATFIWMQGESDATEEFANVYERSLIGLYEQLIHDIKNDRTNFVIGRLNDHATFPDWHEIRQIQVKVGTSNSRFGWVNTDDLNDGYNSDGEEITNHLHMSVSGYSELGYRFADKAIQLIRSN